MGFRASGPLCSTNERQAPAPAGVWGQGPNIMRISGCLGRAGAEHHANQRVSWEGRGRASCASAGVWGGQGPSIMRISGCLGRAGAEHHAHQRVSGEGQRPSIMRISGCLGRAGAEHHAHQRLSGEGRGRASCASAGVWGASNPVQSKSNEIKFRWTCEKTNPRE